MQDDIQPQEESQEITIQEEVQQDQAATEPQQQAPNANNRQDRREQRRPASKRFEDFGVWQSAHELVVTTHRLTSIFDPTSGDMRDRLVNAAHEISKTLVQGYNRRDPKMKLEFYEASRDATFIYQDVLLTAKDLSLFADKQEDFDKLLDLTIESRKRVTGLIKKYREIAR